MLRKEYNEEKEEDLIPLLRAVAKGEKVKKGSYDYYIRTYTLAKDNETVFRKQDGKILIPKERFSDAIMNFHAKDHAGINQTYQHMTEKYVGGQKYKYMVVDIIENCQQCRKDKEFLIRPSGYSRRVFRTEVPETSEILVNHSYVTVYYQNVRSIRRKTVALSDPNVNIYAITETWIDDSVRHVHAVEEWRRNGYKIFRGDRTMETALKNKISGRGGGVLIAIRNKHPATSIRQVQIQGVEMVWLSVKLENEYVTFVCAYFQNNDPTVHRTAMNEFFDRISKLMKSKLVKKIVILGDFNVPVSDSSSETRSKENIDALKNYLIKFDLININNVRNRSERLLDLVLVKKTDQMLRLKTQAVIDPIVKPDEHHPPLTFTFPCGTE